MDQHQRHLAAILFTDIVGYTSMMQENEVQAVSAIKRHNVVLERLATSFHRHIVNYFGDGSLCVFQSANEAVQCALELQKEEKEFEEYMKRALALDNSDARALEYQKALKDHEKGQFSNGFENSRID
jgi:class 3 adenylate cyclase